MIMPLLLVLTFLITSSCSSLEYVPAKPDETQQEQGLGTFK